MQDTIQDTIQDTTMERELISEEKDQRSKNEIKGDREKNLRKMAEYRENINKIKEREKKKIRDSKIRRKVRKELLDEDDEEEKILRTEEIKVKGKANGDFNIEDPRVHVIPSKLYCKNATTSEQNQYDETWFKSKATEKYSNQKITQYISIMFMIFDIEPYYEVTKTIKDKSGIKTETELRPNDLPLFSKFGFETGLTKSEIQHLYEGNSRFAQAYDMCLEKQEQILITNMLLGLYGSNASAFTAKNLLGWKSEESVDVTGKLDVANLINRVISDTRVEDFMVDEDIKIAATGTD